MKEQAVEQYTFELSSAPTITLRSMRRWREPPDLVDSLCRPLVAPVHWTLDPVPPEGVKLVQWNEDAADAFLACAGSYVFKVDLPGRFTELGYRP